MAWALGVCRVIPTHHHPPVFHILSGSGGRKGRPWISRATRILAAGQWLDVIGKFHKKWQISQLKLRAYPLTSEMTNEAPICVPCASVVQISWHPDSQSIQICLLARIQSILWSFGQTGQEPQLLTFSILVRLLTDLIIYSSS